MIKRTLLAAAAAMVMCGVASAQDGTYHDNVNKNMNPKQDMKSGQDMQNKTAYGMRSYDDLNNWNDHSSWMKDVFMGMNSRDAAALQMALWRLPSHEEMAVRKALQKCHMGTDAMMTSIREHNAMSQGSGSSTMMTNKFMMSDMDVWNSSLQGMTTFEQRQLNWAWEHMLGSEQVALMNALRACHEHHWTGMNKSGSGY